jgi:hypothetical protein
LNAEKTCSKQPLKAHSAILGRLQADKDIRTGIRHVREGLDRLNHEQRQSFIGSEKSTFFPIRVRSPTRYSENI